MATHDSGSSQVGALSALSSWLLAVELTDRTEDCERAGRMRVVAADKAKAIREAFDIDVEGEEGVDDVLNSVGLEARGLVLVDLLAADPFLPHQLRYDDGIWEPAIEAVASRFELGADFGRRLIEAWRDVDGMHAGLGRGHVIIGSLAGVAMIGLTVFTLGGGPALVGGIGTGLSGAAATAHGLALLGGTTGLFGMAGGTIVLAVAPAALAAGSVSVGASLLRSIPVGELERQVRSAQVSLEAVYERESTKAAGTEAGLRAIEADLEQRLTDEHVRSDPGSEPIEAIERALTTTRSAIDWIEHPSAWQERIVYGRAKHVAKDWAATAADDAKRAAREAAGRLRGE
ncbi:MAG TPA: hypothetical protein VJT75_08925 [Thermoleophilaceae bacterium]|nr:hypothetical protein [Thermoleophilaceae bacterium]